MPRKKRMAKAGLKTPTAAGGRPSLFGGPKRKVTIILTETAIAKAEADATRMGAKVSTSNAIEQAIRNFTAEPLPAV